MSLGNLKKVNIEREAIENFLASIGEPEELRPYTIEKCRNDLEFREYMMKWVRGEFE